MKNHLAFVLLSFILISCGGTKTVTKVIEVSEGSVNQTKTTKVKYKEGAAIVTIVKEPEEITKNSNKSKVENIIDHAKTFEGTRYKFGGTTAAGMDCSGLVFTCFKTEDVALPRRSRDMATKGIEVSLDDATEGDLVFFKTNGKKNAISHVGLVVENKSGEIKFIHSTTQLGVIISSMDEPYWKNAFVVVKRLI